MGEEEKEEFRRRTIVDQWKEEGESHGSVSIMAVMENGFFYQLNQTDYAGDIK